MVMARAIERRVWWLNRTAQAHAPLRIGGSEATQVATAANLRPGADWVVSTHRDLALCLAMGVSPLDVMLAVFGRAGDPASGGRLAPGSFGSSRARILTTSPAAGAHVVQAAGIAYASRLQGVDEVTLVSVSGLGAGAGDWHEGINFAAVHRLALVCLIQDAAEQAETPLEKRDTDAFVRMAHGYGVAGDVVDGADFNDCYTTVGQAVERARSGGGPTLLHVRTPDLSARAGDGSRRPREQLEAQANDDPIELMRRDLHGLLLLDEATDDQIQRDCISVVEAAVDQARAAAAPKPAAALDNVYRGITDD